LKFNKKYSLINKERGCDLLGIQEYPDVNALKKRFSDLGYKNVEVYDMLTVYNEHISKEEKTR
jgi:hypothetical protein